MPYAYPYPGTYEITLVTVSRVLQGEAVYPLCGLHHDAAGYFGHPMNKSDTFVLWRGFGDPSAILLRPPYVAGKAFRCVM